MEEKREAEYSGQTEDNMNTDKEELSKDICPPSVARFLNSPLRTIFESPKKLLNGLIQEGGTAVDLGCGGGVFSFELAKMVGQGGKVYAVDVQPEMLEMTGKIARKKKLENRIVLHKCGSRNIGLDNVKADLVIAIHIVHETPDPKAFLVEASSLLNENGCFLIMEPKMHVNDELFKETNDIMAEQGFEIIRPMNNLLGRGKVYKKGRQKY